MHLSNSEGDQPRNPDYEKDIAYVTRHNKWVLHSIGIWPVVLGGTARFLSKIVLGLSNLVLFVTILQCVLHMILEQKDPLLRLKILGLSTFTCICLMKYWALALRKPKIESCIQHVYSDWKQVELQRDRELMLKYAKIGRNLSIYSIIFMYAGGLTYHTVMQYAIGSYVDENNRTIRLLIYPTYSQLYDAQRTPIYEIVYVLQCFCGYVFDTATVAACGLAALFTTHTCGQIDVIKSRLYDLVPGKFAMGNSVNVQFIEIVKHHVKTLRFSSTVETVLQEVCFLEFIGSSIIICLLQYYCMMDWELDNKIGLITYSILLLSVTFNMFILCYTGDLLIEKSTNIGAVCCMIDWYHLPTKTIRNLILIIAMSNTPAKISAGKIVDLSLSTFGNVLKTSFAYLNFLRTTVV